MSWFTTRTAQRRPSSPVPTPAFPQVNPHIVPFYVHPLGRPGRPSSGRERTGGWRGGFLLGALEVSVKEDLRKHLATMQRLQLLVDLFGVDWSHVWLQPLDGSVNIMPSLELQVGATAGDRRGAPPPDLPTPSTCAAGGLKLGVRAPLLRFVTRAGCPQPAAVVRCHATPRPHDALLAAWLVGGAFPAPNRARIASHSPRGARPMCRTTRISSPTYSRPVICRARSGTWSGARGRRPP